MQTNKKQLPFHPILGVRLSQYNAITLLSSFFTITFPTTKSLSYKCILSTLGWSTKGLGCCCQQFTDHCSTNIGMDQILRFAVWWKTATFKSHSWYHLGFPTSIGPSFAFGTRRRRKLLSSSSRAIGRTIRLGTHSMETSSTVTCLVWNVQCH